MTGAGWAESATLTGSAAYRERIALPPDAELVVRLEDVSRMDAPATLLSARRIAMTGVPQPFSLAYDPALIDERMSYAVRAEIQHAGEVWFRTTQAFPVLTRGAAGHVDLILTRAAGESGGEASGLAGRWTVTELRGKLLISEDRPEVDFSELGRIGVKGACNGFNGAAEIEGDKLRVAGPMAGTMRACAGELEQMDRDLVAALSEARSLVRRDDRLALVNAEGVTVLRLRRSE
ncbi:MAG TPA: hypothetical protein DEA05_03510 [Rhodobacteraceae bacterium]|jgi:putative lipoprotein|nr:hypothetical protein [Paracoccaceae bacterium]